MFKTLDASVFERSSDMYVNKFERILGMVIDCFNVLVKRSPELANDENKIRDELVINYLRNDDIRKIVGLIDEKVSIWWEAPESRSNGRTDITFHTENTLLYNDAYYIIECKRLNNNNLFGSTGLNAEYIKNGLFRFTSNFYSSYYKVNGMIGFVVEQLDINANIDNLNNLMLADKRIITLKKMNRTHEIANFEHLYTSIHQDSDSMELKIYHLMLDLSDLIVK